MKKARKKLRMSEKEKICEICGERSYRDKLCPKCYMELKLEELRELEFMIYGD